MNKKDDYWIEEHFGKPELINWYIQTRGPVRFPGEGNVVRKGFAEFWYEADR